MWQERKSYSLSEIAQSIQRMFDQHWQKPLLIRAEMNKLNHYPASGHCYPVLVEKKGNHIAAEMKAVLWKDNYERINRAFLEKVKEPLKDGMQVLMEAVVKYSPLHGLSLEIKDIDPAYSLGDLEREKAQSIERLSSLGIFDHNRSQPLSILPVRWAIISVETSKGYSDFLEILNHNAFGFRFTHMLFPALLQGDKAPAEIMKRLRQIATVRKHFDAVAIVRGGGGEVGLHCYNHFLLCQAICEFPLPVFTGIGHSTNLTVAEMVSHTNGITPTDLANRIIDHVLKGVEPLNDVEFRLFNSVHTILTATHQQHLQLAERALKSTRQRLALEHVRMEQLHTRTCSAPLRELNTVRQTLGTQWRQLQKMASAGMKAREKNIEFLAHRLRLSSAANENNYDRQLQLLEQKVALLDPVNVLKRGYSITRVNGKAVTSFEALNEGDMLHTQLALGSATSIILSTQKD